MSIQAKFSFFIEFYLSGESKEVKDAFKLDPDNYLDTSDAIKLGMDQNYLLKLKQAWKTVLKKAVIQSNAVCNL